MKKKILWLSIAAVAVVAILVVWLVKADKKEVFFNTATITESTLQITVTSTGSVQPMNQIAVGTQVSGVIVKIHVDFNSMVKAGELLAELDKSLLQEKIVQAKASLSSAQSDLQYAQENYTRIKQLYDQKAETQMSLEVATNKLELAKVGLQNAISMVRQAETNIGYADIRSPISGIVQNRGVDEGQTVAASFNTPTLFTIANNLKNMEVQANVDEADIGSVKLGQRVDFTVDAYPNDVFKGTVSQIRLQPVTNNNVVTYVVIIAAPNPDEKLLPGMTANSTIIVQEVTGLVVPMEALKYNPSEEVQKALKMPAIPHAESNTKHVWTKTAEGSLVEQEVHVGLSDGSSIIVEQGLVSGDVVVLSASLDKGNKKKAAASNPLIPKRPGGGR